MTSMLQRLGLLLALLLATATAQALPRFSLISGTRCSACHFTPHGGGLRTELGWDAMNKGAWRWPWERADPGEDASGDGEDLFDMPVESPVEMPEGSGAPGDDAGAAGGFEAQEPLPAHETASATDETTSDQVEAPAAHTNSLFDGLITPGADMRLQVAKIGRPPGDKRMLLPMQAQLNLAVTPLDWLAVHGGYNYAATQRSFPGQSSWEATLQVHPGVTLPVLRLGYMQPSIGIRHDDHTMFTRREVAGASAHPLIPAGYAELGAELTYEGISWLTLNAGVFGSKNIADIDPVTFGDVSSIADFSKPSMLGRIMLWPQDLDLGFNGELGASYFANGDFRMINIFGGFGMSDRASILVEGLMADYPSGLGDGTKSRIRNVSIMGSYQLMTWLSLDWRYEWGQTEVPAVDETQRTLAHAHQAVFGLEFFPLPYVEIRPEYRFFQTEPFAQFGGYLQGQYTLQLHLFY